MKFLLANLVNHIKETIENVRGVKKIEGRDMAKQIKIESCGECDKKDTMRNPPYEWICREKKRVKTLTIRQNIINKTIHPDCPLEDIKSHEDDATKHIRKAIEYYDKLSQYKRDKISWHKVFQEAIEADLQIKE